MENSIKEGGSCYKILGPLKWYWGALTFPADAETEAPGISWVELMIDFIAMLHQRQGLSEYLKMCELGGHLPLPF